MIPDHCKLHIVNNLHASNDLDASSNANEALVVTLAPWKFDSNGALSYGSEITRTLAADVAGGASSVVGAEIDNGTNKYLGYHGRITLDSDDTTHDGAIDLYVEFSTDGGTSYPSDESEWDVTQDGIHLASLQFTHGGAGVDTKSVSFDWE